ncbi:MAG: hypothetical protein ACKO4T_10955 [Planctomycetaceae bacterium]
MSSHRHPLPSQSIRGSGCENHDGCSWQGAVSMAKKKKKAAKKVAKKKKGHG